MLFNQTEAKDGDVRLYQFNAANPDPSKGTIEMYKNGQWHLFCTKDKLNQQAANLICKQLNYVVATKISRNTRYGTPLAKISYSK